MRNSMATAMAMKTKLVQPTYEDLSEVMETICSLHNVWAFCLPWQTKKPELFNKFMEICAWFKNDESYLAHKTLDTEFMYHKKLKKNVLVSSHPPSNGHIVFRDANTGMWCRDKSTNFSAPHQEKKIPEVKRIVRKKEV